MNVKRFLVLGILGLFFISMMSGVLGDPTGYAGEDEAISSANIGAEEAGRNAGEFVKSVVDGGKAFFEAALVDTGTDRGEEWLSELFFAILLGMIIYTVISSFFSSSSPFVQWGITITITTLSWIGMPEGYLSALLTSYGAMGLTLLTVIPFLIMIIFTVKIKDLWIARGTWFFYMLYYLSLVVAKWWGLDTGVSGWPYFISLLGGIVMFFFIPFIRHMFNKEKLDSKVEEAKVAINKNKAIQKLARESREAEVAGAGA